MTGIKPRSARVTIYQGDDLAELAVLDQRVSRAEAAVRLAEQRAKAPTVVTLDDIGDFADVEGARERHAEAVAARDEFAEGAETRGVVVVLHALPRKAWRALTNEHPARDDVDTDKRVGVNEETLAEELVLKSVDDEQSTIDGDLAGFLDALSDYDFERLYVTAFALNRGSAMADPTLRLASGTSQT